VTHDWVWPALFLLGCYHGINPGMGWLFAVALALQERSVRAIWLALGPITLGHLMSVMAIVGIAVILKAAVPGLAFRAGAAAVLLGMGLYRGIRARHFRWAGLRVGFWGLTLWAFLMATGHGAGLMLLPFVNVLDASPATPGMAGMAMPADAGNASWLAAVGVHTAGYLGAMTAVAFIVYRYFGVRILRTAWINFDLIWAVALAVTGVILLLT
jgi:hypothetical protein